MLTAEERQQIHESVREAVSRLYGPECPRPIFKRPKRSLSSDGTLRLANLPIEAAGIVHGLSRYADE